MGSNYQVNSSLQLSLSTNFNEVNIKKFLFTGCLK